MSFKIEADREFLVEETFQEAQDILSEKMTWAERFGLLDRKIVEKSVRDGEREMTEKLATYYRGPNRSQDQCGKKDSDITVKLGRAA